MKKIKLDPLSLDKETIAKLDEKQLEKVLGGGANNLFATSSGCASGQSACGTGGTSSGCDAGGSGCFVD